MTSKNIYDLEMELLSPESNCYLDSLLDVVSMVVADCNFTSAHKSKNLQRFRDKFSDVAELITKCRTKLSDFDTIKVIGRGGFGKVHLVRNKQTRRVYAMKIMNKAHLLDHSQSAFWEERDIMVQANNTDWLVSCHEAFMDLENIYLCMDFLPGGDLYYWLEEYGQFTEHQTKFYLSETILALDVLHSLGYIHRDLKPDNLLLDAKGHLKLADFGSCVRLDKQGRYFCSHPMGTPDYISPEMLDCQSKPGYIGPECDWWSLGIICYEMLFGEPPFYGESLVETYRNILAHEKTLKIVREDATDVSDEAEDFIRKLLKTSDQRLGNDSVDALKTHAFFSDIDWVNLKNTEAPIRPVVNSEIDTSNIKFDTRQLSDQNTSLSSSSGCSSILAKYGAGQTDKKSKDNIAKKYIPPSYFTGDNLSFAGFTYHRDQRYCRHLMGNNNFISPSTGVVPDSTNDTVPSQGVYEDMVQSVKNQLTLTTEELNLAKKELSKERETVNLLRNENQSLLDTKKSLQSDLQKNKQEFDNIRSDLIKLKNIDLINQKKNQAELIEKCHKLEEELQKHQAEHNSQGDVEKVVNGHDRSDRILELTAQLDLAKSQIKAFEKIKLSHLERMDDLNEQIEAAAHFSQPLNNDKDPFIYQAELDTCKGKYQTMKDSFEKRIKDLEDKISSLNAALEKKSLELKQSETLLSSKELSYQRLMEQYESEKKNWLSESQSMKTTLGSYQNQILESNDQRNEITQKCSDLEKNVEKLTNETSLLRNDNNLLQLKFSQTLNKLVELANTSGLSSITQGLSSGTGPYMKKGKGVRSENDEAYYQLEKKYKNLESKYNEITKNNQSTVQQLKQDLSERTEMLAVLSETNQRITNELAMNKAQLAQLYDKFDTNGYGNDGQNADTILSYSTSEDCEDKKTEECHGLECQVDLPVKGRGREKLVWVEKYAVLRPTHIFLFNSREDKDKGLSPIEEFHIGQIVHAREASSLDVHHAKKEDIPRVLQLFYDDSQLPEDESMLNATTATSSSSSLSHSFFQNPDGTYNWMNHIFQSMTFRFANQLCDVCQRPCSDFLNPPPAMECVRCRLRIHAEHVEKCNKIVSCNNATKIRLIRMTSESEKKIWIGQIRRFIDEYKVLNEVPNGKLDSRSYSIATYQARSLYKSMRSSKSISGNSLFRFGNQKNTSSLAIETSGSLMSTPKPNREKNNKTYHDG